MEKAQAEGDEIVGQEKKMEESDIEKLPYLQAVAKEVLRLDPAINSSQWSTKIQFP